MSAYALQLVVGLVALTTWACAFLVARARRRLPPGLLLAGMLGLLGSLVVLVFGSLFLLGVATPAQWDVVGTGMRAFVALTGVGALIAAATEE